MKRVLLTLLVAFAMIPAFASAAKPEGWFLAGNDSKSYLMETDASVKHGGKNSGRLESIAPSKGFGTMMQSIEPGEYAGKRVRYSGWVRSSGVENWAGMWMRVDGPDNKSTAFDNMQDRAIKGSTEWQRYSIVLDVDEKATGISFGILLAGKGKVWLNDLQFEIVDKTVPTTGPSWEPKKKPVNLDFGK